MERVKKGEKYWSFLIYTHGYRILEFTEGESYAGNDEFDAEGAAFGNYFHTKEEAEAMTRKIKAVLNGADVIEMPSEEEIKKAIKEVLPSDPVAPWCVDGYCRYIVDWLKSKIVK